jgi:LPXTG-motif cell wall-anchored protein
VAVPSVSPGAMAAEVDGVRVEGAIAWADDTTLVGRIGGVAVRMQFSDPSGRSPRNGAIAPGTRVVLALDGVRATSEVAVDIFSTPRRLLTVEAGSSSITESFTVPTDMEAGDHVFQISTLNTSGQRVTMWTGVSVDAGLLRLPATGAGSSPALPIAAGMVVFGMALVLIATRRHLRPLV